MYRDTEKFIELLKPHYNDAVNYCTGLCYRQSPDDAKDLLQESLLKSLENIGSLKEEGKFRSWLFTIITREFYNSHRRSFWKRFTSSDAIQMPDIFNKAVTNGNDNYDIKDTLMKALSQLKSKERSSILLFEIGGFSLEEITKMENERSISAVKSRLSRTRGKLQKIIKHLESNSGDGEKINTNFKGDLKNDLEDETIRIIAGLKK
jgi:RNA polymerase sigma-70 factor (ECF subfamily)